MKKIIITYEGKDYTVTPDEWKNKYRSALNGKVFQYEIIDEPMIDETTPFKITDGKIVPQSRSERAYDDMQKQIGIEREQQQVKDLYGWMTENPIMDFVAPMVAPASMETIHEGKMPSLGDIGIDAGLNIASRFIPVPGGAGALRTIGKNALIGRYRCRY